MTGAVDHRRIDGPHGAVPVRVYTPPGPVASRAGLVWAHGGAFFGGDLDMPESDLVARQIADRGITVDYRLVPIMDWATGEPTPDSAGDPVASEEVTAAVRWAAGSGLGVSAWAVGGASAGADLAAGAALRLRDGGGRMPRALLLVYPVLHAALPPLPAELAAKVATLPNPELIGAESVRRMNLNYVRDRALLDEPYAFPGGHDLTGLPPTFILNADLDPLRASGQQFGAELAAAGVDVAVVREPGVRHGHLNEPGDPGAARSIDRLVRWLLTVVG
jgi:acetyl esterase